MTIPVKDNFDKVNDLIVAVSHLLWPIFCFVIVLMFKSEISDILKRLKKGKIFGQELELEKEISDFKNVTEKAQENTPVAEAEIIDEEIIDSIINKSSQDPKVGVMLLAREIEKEIIDIAAATGHLTKFHNKNFRETFSLLVKNNYLSQDILTSVNIFWNLRNKIVHGKNIDHKDEILKVLDIGLTLLKTLQAIPRNKYFVKYANIPLYSNGSLSTKRENVTGLILEENSPNGLERNLRIYPTTITNYEVGEQIAWEWSFSNRWGESWYEDPENHMPKMAFSDSVEFIGRQIKDI